MPLYLQRPLIFFDLETTGVIPTNDRIIELAVVKLNPDETETTYTALINPTIPIPPAATQIHGLTDGDVKDKPTFRDLAGKLYGAFRGCDLSGFNIKRFDLVMLIEEFKRCGLDFPEPGTRIIDVQRIYHKKEERNLAAAYRYYCGKEHQEAHIALGDVLITKEVLMAQLERYDDIGRSIEELDAFCNDGNEVDFAGKLKYNEERDIVFAFGKHAGKRVADNLDYAAWMIEADFSADTKSHLHRLIEGNKDPGAGS